MTALCRILGIFAAVLVAAPTVSHTYGQVPTAAKTDLKSKSKLPAALLAAPRAKPFEVSPIDRSKRPSVKAAAARIDALLEARQRADGIDPGEALDDSAFVRRVYLELGGRIPTCDEALGFLSQKGDDRHDELIETILESPDYVSRFYCLWAETLRLREITKVYTEPYLDWVKRSIASNRRYDEWVREMITADGKRWTNPAVGYQLRDIGMPLSYVDNTVRVFLGTQIGCAQCHDHPTERWTRRQFYEIAAYTYGNTTGLDPYSGPAARNYRNLMGHVREIHGDNKIDAMPFLRNNATVVAYRPKPLKFPDGAGRDTGGGEAVRPRVLWGEASEVTDGVDGREVFARWMTSRDNRQFPRTIANRLWKVLMGVGIVEPIDDFTESNPPSHPELLEHLTDEMLRLEFDLREFVRIIASTRAWRNRAVPHDPASGETFAFVGPALRRMTAEQVWDSVLTLASHDLWAYQRPSYETVAAAVELDLSEDGVSVEEAREGYLRHLSAPVYPMARHGNWLKDYVYASRSGYYAFARASELPAPLPLSHPLRVFGQSERESVDGGRTEGTISQVLFMLNNLTFPGIATEAGTRLERTIAARNPRDWVNTVFVSILTRMPDSEERELAEATIAGGPTPWKGIKDLIAALLNTREFLFIQ